MDVLTVSARERAQQLEYEIIFVISSTFSAYLCLFVTECTIHIGDGFQYYHPSQQGWGIRIFLSGCTESHFGEITCFQIINKV